MIGWIMPRSRSEATSSSSSVLEKLRRGLRAFGRSAPVGSRHCPRGRSTEELSPATSPIKAARPRPSRDRDPSSAIAVFPRLSLTQSPSSGTQLLLALDDLGGEPQIGFATAAFEIVDEDRLTVGWRFRYAHIARDD